MTEIQLPEKAAATLRKIRQSHKVAFEPFRVNDIELQLLQVSDIESLLHGKDPFKDVSEFPFWVKIWEAAIVLANVMATLPMQKDAKILELGAGLAAPGLIAAARGFKVTLSDYENLILDFQRVSAAANDLKGIEYKLIDWRKPPELTRFDMIIGAEILFRDDLFSPLLKLFHKMLAPGGVIYLAHDSGRQSLYKFMEQAKKDYRILAKKIQVTSEGEGRTIILNKLEQLT